jgi:hypothetical protein
MNFVCAATCGRLVGLARILRIWFVVLHSSTFDSLGEACDFYNLYSWEHGFGIRYGKSRLNVEQVKCMQEIVCGCSVSFRWLTYFVRAGR